MTKEELARLEIWLGDCKFISEKYDKLKNYLLSQNVVIPSEYDLTGIFTKVEAFRWWNEI